MGAMDSSMQNDIQAIQQQIGRLQADLANIGSIVGSAASHGLEDARRRAANGVDDLVHGGQNLALAAMKNAARAEADFESTVRSQPLIALAAAMAVGVLLSFAIRRQ
jgi:ElaB/YqjD/DUF883 family membrane-anchored ribosome-binding protein